MSENTSNIENITAALREHPQLAKLMVVGDINDDLVKPEGVNQDEEIVADLLAVRLEYMLVHFLSH